MKKSSVFFLALVAGCGSNPNSTLTTSNPMRGIRFGTTTKDFPSVVALVMESSGKKRVFCTATAIDKRVVLTAGHCAEVLRSQVGAKFSVRTSDAELPIDAGLFHSEYRAASAVGSVDLALLRVKGTLSALSEITSLDPSVGTKVTAVGFGQDGMGADGNGTVGVKKTGTLTIAKKLAATGASGKSIANALLFFDYSNSDSEQAACPGDSGGPVLLNGQIAGVVSGGQMYLGIRKCIYSLNTIYTSIFAFRAWVKGGVGRLIEG